MSAPGATPLADEADTTPEATSPQLNGAVRAAAGPGRWSVLRLIRLYQDARFGKPSPCRFVPSCSVYAAEAVERHGIRRGGWLALRRIARCHPWGGHGLDQVPETGARRPRPAQEGAR